MKKNKEKIYQVRQEEFLKGREYERIYQLGKEKDSARRIVIKWFSSLSLVKNQLIAEDVSKLLSLLSPITNKSDINKE